MRVFPDQDGRSRTTYDRAVDRFQLACSQVQLPDDRFTNADGKLRQPAFHDLQRTFARVALRSGMSESDVMLIAGLKTPVMPRRYLGSNEEGQRQALAAADKAFGTVSFRVRRDPGTIAEVTRRTTFLVVW